MADRRWRHVGIAAIILGAALIAIDAFALEFGVPFGLPRQIGPGVLGLGIALVLLQRRTNRDQQPPN